MITTEQVAKSVLEDARGAVDKAVVWYGDARRTLAVGGSLELSQLADSRRRDVELLLNKLVDTAKSYGALQANRPAGEPDTVVEDGNLVATLDRVLQDALVAARQLHVSTHQSAVVQSLMYAQRLVPKLRLLEAAPDRSVGGPTPSRGYEVRVADGKLQYLLCGVPVVTVELHR